MELCRTSVRGHETAVRTLTEEYFTEVNRLGREYFADESYGVDIPEITDRDIDRLREEPLSDPLFLAYRDDSLAGMGQFHRRDSACLVAKRIFLRKPHRGNGIGRTLTERMIDDASADGFETVHLNVSPYHERARRLYQSLGFEEIEPPEWTSVSPELHDDWQFLRLSLET